MDFDAMLKNLDAMVKKYNVSPKAKVTTQVTADSILKSVVAKAVHTAPAKPQAPKTIVSTTGIQHTDIISKTSTYLVLPTEIIEIPAKEAKNLTVANMMEFVYKKFGKAVAMQTKIVRGNAILVA